MHYVNIITHNVTELSSLDFILFLIPHSYICMTLTCWQQIVPPVLNSFSDQDSRVRYYACEALYNIAKVII